MAEAKTCLAIFTCLFSVILLVSIILFSLSFKLVNLNEVGIYRNTYTKEVDSKKLYRSGRQYKINILK